MGGNNWLIFGMAMALLVTNLLGAGFTIRRFLRREKEPLPVGAPSAKMDLSRVNFQRVSVLLGVSAAAVGIILMVEPIRLSGFVALRLSVLGLIQALLPLKF